MTLLLFIDSFAFAYKKVYLQQPSSYGIAPRRTIYRPTYNPYGAYYNPYQYQRLNSNNIQRLQRLHRLRQMDRLRRSRLNNYLSWFNRGNNGGTLTGYSVPVNQDVYRQMGISPYNSNIKQNPKVSDQHTFVSKAVSERGHHGKSGIKFALINNC